MQFSINKAQTPAFDADADMTERSRFSNMLHGPHGDHCNDHVECSVHPPTRSQKGLLAQHLLASVVYYARLSFWTATGDPLLNVLSPEKVWTIREQNQDAGKKA